jgi:dTDP-4-dehydrorhamnose reductase
MNRILLIGKDGQVGQELQKTLSVLGSLVSVGRDQLDLTQPDAIRQVIQATQPTLIVNAAAYTAVDKAETEIDLAKTINTEAPTVMAEIAQRMGSALIHISTDYVFDGAKNTPYLESEPTHPLGIYGASKLAGEQGIQQITEQFPAWQYGILRTAWVYGTQGKGNFVKTMLRLGAEREEVRVVYDQTGTPTWSADIARAIAKLSSHFLNPNESESESLRGVYHFTNSGVTSWYDFAVEIFATAKSLGFPLQIQRVIPITTAEYPTAAQRPAYSVLSCRKISALLDQPICHWRQALQQMLTELYSVTL